MELSPLNDTKGQVPYDDKSNQGLCNDCLKEVLLKNLGIKLCSITTNLCLVVILLKLLARNHMALAFSLLNYNLVVSL